MKVTEITVGTGRKLGLPGYSSLDISAFVTVTLEGKEDVQEAYKRAWNTVEEQVIGRIKVKGLESPVAAESQNKEKPTDWLEHDTPEQQRLKISSAKKLTETEEKLKAASIDKIPSIMPTRKGVE